MSGIKTAGSILPTLILWVPSIFIPSPIIKSPPTEDIWAMTSGIRKGLIYPAASVIVPWYKSTETEENKTPIPMVDENMIAAMPSSVDFAKRVL